MRKQIRIFVSYAHKNSLSAKTFIEALKEYSGPSKHFEYVFWQDLDLLPGEKWEKRISEELQKCDCGILLISASFLNSKYITEKEWPTLIADKKPIIPVMLSKINFEHHDLHGLQEVQIFRLSDPAFSAPRSYEEVKGKRKAEFIDKLFAQMEDRLIAVFGDKK